VVAPGVQPMSRSETRSDEKFGPNRISSGCVKRETTQKVGERMFANYSDFDLALPNACSGCTGE